MRGLQSILALLDRGQDERLIWRSEAVLARQIHCDLIDASPKRAARHVSALARLAVALSDLGSPTAYETLVRVLEQEPLIPQHLRTARELHAARTATVTGIETPTTKCVETAPGVPRGDIDLHQRRWADMERRRALGRR